MIDKQSPLPIYYQIEKDLKDRIERGEWQEGHMIPSEREYAEHYNVSRMTVRQAITNLVNDGFLRRQRGKGTFVASKKIQQKMVRLTSFTEDMKQRNMIATTKVLSFTLMKADSLTAALFQMNEGEEIAEVQRMRLADGLPMALETSKLNLRLLQGITEKVIQHSLYDYIEHTLNLKVGAAVQKLEASVARQHESALLQITKGSPVLLMTRETKLKDGQVFESVKSVYRGDRYAFVMEMNREG
ncbi:GntR family transcriptional regulator [Fictibacillus macauensis ZFHKF-1]|uniref:GntR family transcriptional regulator n=1 Tax=Fictibacillus macauensis ZFHKF-1 TaxID=1196324 RepID=I8AJ89_9BACL|nr:GntR family transcriptional regulator [Fictibacillus macauensis]EIT85559.1 GntR family transcriptional regulator [Fictibacillus macauensis ZFHKF-1]